MKFTAACASLQNDSNLQRHLVNRDTYQQNRGAALMYGFSYTIENPGAPPTFCGAGGGETTDDGVVREGDTSSEGMREKAARVMTIMEARLSGLAMKWADATTVNVYTANTNADWLESELLARMGADAVHGIHWHLSRPPIIGLDFEMDVRGNRTKLWL